MAAYMNQVEFLDNLQAGTCTWIAAKSVRSYNPILYHDDGIWHEENSNLVNFYNF